MSTLSKTQLRNIIKKYVEDFINEFELEEATSKSLNPDSYDDQLNGYGNGGEVRTWRLRKGLQIFISILTFGQKSA